MAATRKAWIAVGALTGVLLGYLIGPFAYLPYMLSHLNDQPRPSFEAYTILYGKVISGARSDPYNQVFRQYAAWQCTRHPGACVDPPDQ